MKMIKFCVFVILLLGYNGCFADDLSCYPTSTVRVKCKSLSECPPLMQWLARDDRTPQQTEALRKAQCGFEGGTPKVCCPEPCYTPEGKAGRCVNVHDCPRLLTLLQNKPVTQQVVNYITNSKCNSSDKYSVCCSTSDNTPVAVDGCAATGTAQPMQASAGCCGVQHEYKILRGPRAALDAFGWLSLIEYVKDGSVRTLCGGALISTRYVLTAAHCLLGSIIQTGGVPTYVRLGEFNTTSEGLDCVDEGMGVECTEGTVTLPVEELIPHPDFKEDQPARWQHDIGLIRLAAPAPYTDFIRPICLPSQDWAARPPEYFRLVTGGWGAVPGPRARSDVKLTGTVAYVNNTACQAAYNEAARTNRYALGAGQLCAGGSPGQELCRGDSGGPLMFAHEGHYEVVGVTSFGHERCGTQYVPGVFTNVWHYDAWIRSNIRP